MHLRRRRRDQGRAAEALRELAELAGIPVITTLMARGAFPDSHPLSLGMPGMHGNYAAVAALQEADLLVALGARFDDRVTGKLDTFAPKAKIVHADIDPAEIGKNRTRRRAHRGRRQAGHRGAAGRRPGGGDGRGGRRHRGLAAGQRPVEAAVPAPLRPAGRGPLKPQHVVERLRR